MLFTGLGCGRACVEKETRRERCRLVTSYRGFVLSTQMVACDGDREAEAMSVLCFCGKLAFPAFPVVLFGRSPGTAAGNEYEQEVTFRPLENRTVIKII